MFQPYAWTACCLLLAGLLAGCETAAEEPFFYLPDDLEVTLWAESPLFFNPANIDLDARGRVWVAEARNYRDFNNAAHDSLFQAEGDRIVILEDTDGDGRADASKVFVQDPDLRAPLGIAVVDGDVLVSSAPSLYRYIDDDGDDRADRREVFLTGFGGYDHDHGLHTLVAGPDGRWYFNTGNAGPHVVTDKAGWTLRSGSLYRGGTPYNDDNESGLVSDDGRVWVGGLALRVQPDGRGLEVLAHNSRNAYELGVDSFGDLWQNDNDDEVLACRTTWLMEGGSAGYFSEDGARTWQADRRPGQTSFAAHWHQDDPGVLPAGDRVGAGAPTGLVRVESDALGSAYRGLLLSADAGRNVVFGYHPEPDGAGYALDRFDFLTTLPASNDHYVWNDDVSGEPRKWFRPSDVAVGPDGALYVADWYDPVVGGHLSRDGQGVGRIYRIAPKGRPLGVPALDLSTTEGQVAALLSPATNVRYSGFVRLRAQGERAVPRVRRIYEEDPNPYHKARALWLLAHLGPSGVEVVEAALGAEAAALRLTAFRALRQVKKGVLVEARRLARDPSPAVRREVALALRDVPFEAKADVLRALAGGFDGADRWYLEALGLAAEGDEARAYTLWQRHLDSGAPAEWPTAFAALAWRLHPPEAAADLRARAEADGLDDDARTQALTALGFVDDARGAEAMAALAESDIPDVAEQARWWLAYRQGNLWRDYDVTLAWGTGAAPADLAHLAALRATALDDERPMDERADAAASLMHDPSGGLVALSLLAEGGLPYQIQGSLGRGVRAHPDRTVRTLAYAFSEPPNPAFTTEDVLSLRPDVENGRQRFLSTCITCHRHGAAGIDFGPELSGAYRTFGREGLAAAIVDPGASVAHGYEPVLLRTEAGGAATGFLLADGATVTLKEVYGRTRSFDARDVAFRTTLDASLMPTPGDLGLSAQDVADITAFLLAGPPAAEATAE